MSKLLVVLVIFLLSISLIFYQFNEVPKHLSYDEVEFARLALSLDNKPYTPYSNLATGHSTLYFYILLGSFKSFGVNNFALRFPSAMFGILGVIGIFFIFKKVYKNYLFVFILVFIFLTNRWYFNFARFAFEATFLLFLELCSVYFLFRFQDSRKWQDLFFCAFFSGLAFHSYYPGRLFFLLPLFFIIKSSLSSTTQFKRLGYLSFKYWNLFGIWKLGLGFFYYIFVYLSIFTVIASPLMLYYIHRPDLRLQQISLFSNPKLSWQKKFEYFNENVKKTAFMFHVKGDMNGRHNFPGKPALNPFLGLLMLGGLFFAVKYYKNIYNQFFLSYFTLSLLLTLFTLPQDNPNMLRTFTVLPSVVYFVGVALKKTLGTFQKIQFAIVVIVTVAIGLSTLYELRTYFLFQRRVVKNSFEVTCALEHLKQYIFEVPKKCRVQKNLF